MPPGTRDELRGRCFVLCGGALGWVWRVSGRLAPCRHPIRATARARITQFAEANSTLRWLRFLAMPG